MTTSAFTEDPGVSQKNANADFFEKFLFFIVQRLCIAPLIFVRPDAALDNFLHLGNGHLVKAAWFHSLKSNREVISF